MSSSAQAQVGTSAPDTTTRAPLSPSEVRRGLRLSIVEGTVATVNITIVSGALLTGLALLLGATPLELGLIGALPFISQLFQFVGAYLEERLGERRRLTFLTALLSRVLWVPVAALPFLDGLGAARIALFLLLLALSQALIGIAANAWTSWMTDLVPPRQRGRYFGIRNTIVSVSAMLSGWLSGYLFDAYRAAGSEEAGYGVIFGIAALFGIAGALVLLLQPEPPMQRRQRVRVRELFSAPLQHRSFRSFSLAAAGWSLVTGVAGPFFNAYGLQTLQLSFADLALFGVVTSAVSLGSQPLIGRLQDRHGDRPVLIGSALGVVLLPFGWVTSTPGFLLPLWLTSIFAGVFWPGINQGFMNLLMERAPAEGRGAYVAFFGALNGVGTFVSGLLGGVIAAAIGPSVTLALGPLLLTHYSLLFVISSLGRLTMALVFVRRL